MNSEQLKTLMTNAHEAYENIQDYPDLEACVLSAWSHHDEALRGWFTYGHTDCGCTDVARCSQADAMYYVDDEPHNM
jgi:hypothetical protein